MLLSENYFKEKEQNIESHSLPSFRKKRKDLILNINKTSLNPSSSTVTLVHRSNPGLNKIACKLFFFKRQDRESFCKMTLKEGDAVEVWRRGKEQYDSWFPGKIISASGCKYTVRYEEFLDRKGHPVIEEVRTENIRPQPPPVKGDRWVVGDITEVFYLDCWKIGKVAKVLNYDRFVIKVFGSIQLKAFQQSDVRVRQAWQNNKWVVLEKVGRNKQINNGGNTSKYLQSRGCGASQQLVHKQAGMKENARQEGFEALPLLRTLKRKHECNLGSSHVDVAMEGGVKERITNRAGQCAMLPARTLPVLDQVAVGSFIDKKMGKKCMIRSKMDVETQKTDNYGLQPLPMPQVTKESSECSIASCSGNGLPDYNIQHSQKLSRDDPGSSFNDAQSMCGTESGRKFLPSYPQVKLQSDIRKLELHAYKVTMQALYASGPLSWEQESLLTNLRLSLHISTEEHLLHLRHLLSSQAR